MMLNDTKFLLIFGSATILLSFYSIWLLLFVYLFTIVIIYYDFNLQSDVRGHALNKVNSALIKIRQLTSQAFNSVICDSYTSRQGAPVVTNMFTNSAWEGKRGGVSPIHRRGSVTTVVGKHTSTPIGSPIYKGADLTCNSSVIKPNLIRRPDRYSLSDTSFNSEHNTSIPNTSGLLTSSRYNIGMGMYADTKSPGLSSRIVQYGSDYDRNRDRITHLPQYGRPGLFPNVNLNKSPKLVKPVSQRSVTVRIAPPESPSLTEMERNSILSNSFKSVGSPQETSPAQSEISTRSVLDALKEISRKRIHARDEIIDQNKRHKKMLSPNRLEQTSKRGWDGSDTTTETSPSPATPTAKKHKQTGYEDIIGSLSSSVHLREQYANKRKLAEKDSPETVKQFKSPNHIKIPNLYYDKSTQEFSTEARPPSPVKTPLRAPTPPPKPTTPITNNVCRLKFISNPPEKENEIFVPFKPPTEEFKKKRLAALLGAISGADWDIKDLTKKFYPDAKDDTPTKSILSPPKDGSAKKHVTFEVPKIIDVTSTSNSITQPISSTGGSSTQEIPLGTSKGLTSLFGSSGPKELPKTSIQFATTTTSVVSFPTTDALANKNASTTTNIAPTTPTTVKFETTTTPSFDTPPATFKITTTTSAPAYPTATTSAPTTALAPNTFQTATTTVPTFGGIKATTTTTQAFGGFSPTTATTTAPPAFGGFVTTTATTTAPPTFGAFVATTATTTAAPSFGGFGATTATTTVASTFGGFVATTATTTAAPTFGGLTATTTATPTFGGFVATTATTTAAPTFGGFGATTATTTAAPTFGGFVATTATTTAAPTFGGFGATETTTTAAPTFGGFGATVTTTTAPPAFGGFVPNAGSTATTTAAPAFGGFAATTATSTAAPAFGGFAATTAPTTTAPTFGGFGATAATTAAPTFGGFGAPNTTVTTPAFGVAKPTPTFGATTTAPGGFGATAAPTFGGFNATATPTFGGYDSAKKTPAFGGFGAATAVTTAAPNFGGFGAPAVTTAPSTFGGFGATPTTAAAFGGFGATTTATPAFGGFGGAVATTTTSGFSAFGTVTTTASSAFGATSPPAFGTPTSSAFGSPKPTTNLFGSGTAFGTPVTTTPSLFGGATSPPAFGTTTSAFGTTAPPAFGVASPPAFGTAAPPAFGSNGFNSFGGAASPPAFAAPAPTPGVFSFGASSTTTDSGNSAFQFGGATKPGGFNFNVGNGGFGGAAPQFTAPAGNMFSIGTSSTAARPRATARHKKK